MLQLMLGIAFKAPIALLLSALSCSIICGGCDWIEPGECLDVGQMFGPCAPDAEAPAGCADGLACVEVPEGRICLPQFEAASDPLTAECAAWRGEMSCSESFGLCFLVCDKVNADRDCEGGTVCDDRHGLCVYPPDGAENAHIVDTPPL